jgi:uncharacterized protein YjbI with pentapeptide repeats
MTPDEIKDVLEKHAKWLNNEEGGEKADLHGANLSGADLSDADLSGANLIGANLSVAVLCCADLRGANLRGANLIGANLSHADLHSANLSGADLSDADLYGADLRGADLDYSTGFSLRCKGSYFNASLKLIYQYLAHLCTISVDESEQQEFSEILDKIRPYALKSHIAGDLKLFESKENKEKK